MLLEGTGITEDPFEALEWLEKAANSGHHEAKKVYNYLLTHPEPFEC